MVRPLPQNIVLADLLPGMFLWVRLVMQSLNECYSEHDLLKAVDTLPKGLDEALAPLISNREYP